MTPRAIASPSAALRRAIGLWISGRHGAETAFRRHDRRHDCPPRRQKVPGSKEPSSTLRTAVRLGPVPLWCHECCPLFSAFFRSFPLRRRIRAAARREVRAFGARRDLGPRAGSPCWSAAQRPLPEGPSPRSPVDRPDDALVHQPGNRLTLPLAPEQDRHEALQRAADRIGGDRTGPGRGPVVVGEVVLERDLGTDGQLRIGEIPPLLDQV
jgi:hypothetical protein